MRSLFIIPIALSSVACSSSEDIAQNLGLQAEAVQSVGAPQPPAPPTSSERTEFTDTATRNGAEREFSYSWPAAVAAEASLVALLTKERDEALTAQKADWAEMLEVETDMPPGASIYNRTDSVEWQSVADTPRFLSLSANGYTYSGGAHGMYGRSSLVWDRAARKAVPAAAMFRSTAALGYAVGGAVCDALDMQREEKRGAPVDREGGAMFDECPAMDDTVVFVASSDGKAFDRLHFYFGPYVAGPYAEGSYEVELPVTASVLDAVKPEYRSAFAMAKDRAGE